MAPERFLDGSNRVSGGVLLPSMDIFSAGCVIAELFLDGKALFDLSQVWCRPSHVDFSLKIVTLH